MYRTLQGTRKSILQQGAQAPDSGVSVVRTTRSGGGRLHAWTNLHYLPMRRSPPTSAPFRCPVCGAGAYARAPALGRLVPHAVLLLLRVLGDVRGSGEVCRQA